jgi:Chalcone isomerase-like
MQRRSLLCLAAWPLAASANVNTNLNTSDEFAGFAARSRATLRFFGLRVYDAELWSAAPMTLESWRDQPFALALSYHRALKGPEIAKRSLVEMRRQGPIAEADANRWLAEMQAAFPDVAEGDRITGRHEPGQGARFFVNGRLQREVREPAFATRFFGIWLSPQTSEPAMREALLK